MWDKHTAWDICHFNIWATGKWLMWTYEHMIMWVHKRCVSFIGTRIMCGLRTWNWDVGRQGVICNVMIMSWLEWVKVCFEFMWHYTDSNVLLFWNDEGLQQAFEWVYLNERLRARWVTLHYWRNRRGCAWTHADNDKWQVHICPHVWNPCSCIHIATKTLWKQLHVCTYVCIPMYIHRLWHMNNKVKNKCTICN